MNNFINKVLLACLLVASGHQLLLGEEVSKAENVKKYVQEFSGYSITLPSTWKEFINEKDTDETHWTFTSGLYRCHPGPGEQPGLAGWIHTENPQCLFWIMKMKVKPGYSPKRCNEELVFDRRNCGWESIDNGELLVQNEKCYWRLWSLPNSKIYQLCFGHKGVVYLAVFAAHEISPEIRQQFDEILKGITFLN